MFCFVLFHVAPAASIQALASRLGGCQFGGASLFGFTLRADCVITCLLSGAFPRKIRNCNIRMQTEEKGHITKSLLLSLWYLIHTPGDILTHGKQYWRYCGIMTDAYHPKATPP
jgi:hypothetical protein